MIDIQYSSPQDLLRPKRRRQDDSCYDNENSRLQYSSYDRNIPEKRARKSLGVDESETEIPKFSHNDMMKLQQEFELQLSSMRSEMQCSLNEKDGEIENNRYNLSMAMETGNEIQRQNVKLDDENKLLKRAVAIQEARYRELSQQHHQLKENVGQAVEYIAQQERIISALKEQLRSQIAPEYATGNNFLPPDVF